MLQYRKIVYYVGIYQFLLSINIFQKVVDKNKNVLASPVNAHIGLSMVAYGAAGRTSMQLQEFLHLPVNEDLTHQAFEELHVYLNRLEKVTFKLANKIYIDRRSKVRNEYKQITTKLFYYEPSIIDTRYSELSTRFMNEWAEQDTDHAIRNVINIGEMTPDTRLFLVNTVYFKGKWARRFEKCSTKNRNFNIDWNIQEQVPTMFSADYYVYGELLDLKAEFIELPFENTDLKMIIIIPNEIDGLQSIIENLESFNRTRLFESGSLQDIHVYLPKFRIQSSIDMKKPLEQLGMTEMFQDNANFIGITNEPVRVNKIVQKTFIDVNEDGNEGSNSTPRKKPFSSSSNSKLKLWVFVADRPFLFKIVNDRLGMTLCIGTVVNPTNN
ncbi:PREDICTED: serine protease inhibitor 3/4-like [Ceratosolen solmsi marchali]|uniref:Serine protease inhibitor 3/4-like n=1 Tax=Ceratosolen solmsi marchali TaxID=326594 RepID=A0AAJ7E112_9HYME|nr:PREDICTED: serine protease inhibitor 3/4-like [Ceratosolen solmsi marchali]